ncbi:hypothetical protein HC752_11675 [Vibrio sp. S9_S30]|uniref:DUF6701 domain-containing protein n=1 Tax=Vibrio sp. S9_S30 TaxID=2720226 RepID=UPI00168031B0|nr:DUF6701 domain-containing protein [Vibrio sp. S9_S30]MBD1557590.1 hypothetical protein [Vibrio sp. S9_S30]
MKLLRFALILMLVLVGASAKALELEYGRYNVNAYAHPDCIDTVCQVNFEKTYDTVPLVFFMSTVSFLNELDSPSDIRILEVTKKYVKFKQKFAPAFYAPPGMENVPMKVIDYVVIEKGVHDFNGVKVIVDDVSTKKYMYALSTTSTGDINRNKKEKIYFDTYSDQGFRAFTGTPGIVHQVQSINNGEDFWLASIVTDVNRAYMNISLERNEVDGYKLEEDRQFPTQEERIGFIAAYGSGEREGIKFAVKNQLTINSYDTGDPVSTGCETYADYAENYDVVPIIVASKNSREGNNGGWLRRCRLETSRSSFMVDEDLDYDDERQHVEERLGYIIFEVPFDVEQCTQFTGPAQTWDTSGSLTMTGSSQISGALDGTRLGYFDVNTHPNNSCTSGDCIADSSLLVTLYNDFVSFTPGSTSLNLNTGSHTVSPGQYDEINVSGDAVVTFTAGDYFASKINIFGNAKVGVRGQVFLHAGETNVYNSARVNRSGVPNDIYFIQHGVGSNFSMYGDARATAFVLSEDNVEIKESGVLNGAIASLTAKMSGDARLKGDIASCNQPVYQLQITPPSATELVESSIPITFNIINNEGNIATDFFGNLNITPSSNEYTCWKATANASCIDDSSSMPIQAGTATYYLYSSVVVEVATVTAYEVDRPYINGAAGPYKFNNSGFIFKPSPLKMIAGKQADVTIKAMRETVDGIVIMDDYDGVKTLELALTSYILPSTGTQQASLVNNNVEFVDGVGQLTLQYNDAGQINVTVRDNTNILEGVMVAEARPDKLALCDLSVQDSVKAHNGTSSTGPGFARAGETFTARIKPLIFDASESNQCDRATTPNFYTDGGSFALAELNYTLHSPIGGSSGVLTQESNSYSPSNIYNFTTRSLAANGIVASMNWNEVGSINLTVSNSNYNYGKGSGIDGDTVTIGRFYPYQFELTNNYTQEGQQGIFTYMEQNFKSLFTVKAQSVDKNNVITTTTNYGEFDASLLMHLNLAMVDDDKNPATEFNDLTERLLTGNIANRDWYKEWTDGTALLPLTVFKFSRVIQQSTPTKITSPDGPYNVRLGLEVDTNNVDCSVNGCTNFVKATALRNDGNSIYDGRKFNAALDMRYGRLALNDVGTNSGVDVTVPVRAEYWNGSQFVANTDDMSTDFDGTNYCRELIWSNSGVSNADLTGSDTNIKDGASKKLTARQNNTTVGAQEQVRLKLRIGLPPAGEVGLTCSGNTLSRFQYLQYNWLGKGDDNPSSVVTFGVYRGNDRVIFRGEPRMY